jgi:hypothetical protein
MFLNSLSGISFRGNFLLFVTLVGSAPGSFGANMGLTIATLIIAGIIYAFRASGNKNAMEQEQAIARLSQMRPRWEKL